MIPAPELCPAGRDAMERTAEALHPDQAWYWTPAWQAGEREADAEIAAGGLKVYDSMGDLFAGLDGDEGTGGAS